MAKSSLRQSLLVAASEDVYTKAAVNAHPFIHALLVLPVLMYSEDKEMLSKHPDVEEQEANSCKEC